MAKKKEELVEEIVENIHSETMEEIMSTRYAIYAKYVIQDRAIPDSRDGLKPVQRRIIYYMYKNGNTINRPTRKCAHTVGGVMGEYHPHGDSSIYEALVRMSQTWKNNCPLIDFQGNNGSIDGDGPAAYRYTEARLSLIAEEMVRDIDKDTVDMALTFDDHSYEPVVMPSRFPNLLVNGTEGIAVAMATDIPPHNLKEVIDAIIYRINHVNVSIEDLMQFVPGPDFPTGGIIYRSQGLNDTYLKGRGRIEISSKTEIIDNGQIKQIIIHEIPFGVIKNQAVYEIDKIRHDKVVNGILEVRDESDYSGIRIAIDIKKEANIEAIYKYLMNKTSLRVFISPNMVAIVNGSPKTMNLLDFVDSYIDHQVDVITRRSKFDLNKSKARLEIVDGLIHAVDIVDEVIHTIRHSKDKADAKVNLQSKFGFSESQSEAIVMLQLYKLSNTDVTVFIAEKNELEKTIEKLEGILSDKKKLDRVIISDLKNIATKFGQDRKTIIIDKTNENTTIDKRDLIAKEEVYVAASRDGYIKRSPVKSFKTSGENALPGLKEGDAVVFANKAMTTDYLICFTNLGNFLHIPVHEIMENKWKDEGKHINYLVSLNPNEKIIKAFALESFRDDLFFVLVSKYGQIKRLPTSLFNVIRYSKVIVAMKLLASDELVDVSFTSGNSNLVIFVSDGRATAFNENGLPLSSLKSGGVKALSKMNQGYVSSLLSYDSFDTRGKVILLTDKGCQRIYEVSNTPIVNRLGKQCEIFRSFKSEKHNLVSAIKVVDKDKPTLLRVLTSLKTTIEVIVDDYHVTPIDKYAKSNIPLVKKSTIEVVYQTGLDRIGKDTTSYFIKPIDNNESDNSENADNLLSEDTKEISEETEDKKYTQISIFDDDFLDDK